MSETTAPYNVKSAKRGLYSQDDEHVTADGLVVHAEQLAGEEVARQPEKGAQPLCDVCYHHHLPIRDGGGHLDS